LRLLRPLSRPLSRVLSVLIVLGWLLQMGWLIRRIGLEGAVALAGDLARYGAAAQWKGVYYRGEKVGFVVDQLSPTGEGYELQQDGRLQMLLLGATSAARLHTTAVVDRSFALRSFTFSLDPGTGPIEVSGRVEGRTLTLTVGRAGSTRSETRELPEPPMLSLNLSRRLAAVGLATGRRQEFSVFDPATLRNAPMTIEVGRREVVQAAGRPVPAFKVHMTFGGIASDAWITDVGEVVREESAMGLMTIKETRARAMSLATTADLASDMLEAAAVVPQSRRRIEQPTAVERLRVKLEGLPSEGPELQGAGQSVQDGVFEVQDTTDLPPEAADPEAGQYLRPEPLIESDDPDVAAEAKKAVAGSEATSPAEKLVRYVNALLEKKPTVSLPSAREVLRTRVGDCNEHTALYVAMARSLGLPARVAVGLVYLHGAFYYHAWPEVYLAASPTRGRWVPVDPTLNQFPADATHLRLARGGLDRQAAILPLIGKAKMTILDVRSKPGTTPTLVGRPTHDRRPVPIDLPRRDGTGVGCWSRPAS
jgi:transglutaminase superfamily protein